jgi:hypothetical protein
MDSLRPAPAVSFGCAPRINRRASVWFPTQAASLGRGAEGRAETAAQFAGISGWPFAGLANEINSLS